MDCARLQRSVRSIRDAKQRLISAAEASPEIAATLRLAIEDIRQAEREAAQILREGIVR